MAKIAEPNIQLVEQQALLARRNFEKAIKVKREGDCQNAQTLYLETKLLARKTTEDFILIGGRIPPGPEQHVCRSGSGRDHR